MPYNILEMDVKGPGRAGKVSRWLHRPPHRALLFHRNKPDIKPPMKGIRYSSSHRDEVSFVVGFLDVLYDRLFYTYQVSELVP